MAGSRTPTEGARPAEVRPIRISRGALVRWAIGAVIFGLAYGVALIFLRRFDLEGPATRAAEWAGVWGVALFLALMMTAVMSPLPDSPIALAGLVAYGPAPGLCLVVLGSWLGAMADFLIVRLLGREAFRRRFPRVAGPIDDLAGRLGFELLVVLRFVPTVSFDIVSYAAAITRMSFWHFAGATLLGQLPGPTVAAVVGANTGGASTHQKVFLSVFFALLLVVLLVTRRIVRRHHAAMSQR
jgi:uncharacterized membrane protein YdjX (TVP38/TMEM64 family)